MIAGSKPPAVAAAHRPTALSRLPWDTRYWFFTPWTAAAALAVLVLVLPAHWVVISGPWAFLASILLFGLSHGASDVWLARTLTLRKRHTWRLPRFLAGYLALVATVVAAWAAAPLPALGLFIILTAWHWGSAEVIPLARRASGAPIIIQSLARGSWIMLAPFAWHPHEVGALLTTWGWLPATLSPPPGAGLSATWLAAWAIALLLDASLAGCTMRPAIGRKGIAAYRSELLILAAVAILLPPLWWITVYFVAFHSWRHALRLSLIREVPPTRVSSPDRTGQLQGALRHLMLNHWGYWLAAALLILPLGWFWHGLGAGAMAWAGSYLAWLAALTLPHSLWLRRLDHFDAANSPIPQNPTCLIQDPETRGISSRR